MTALRRESSQRVRPGCPHFGLHAGACGGCKMQHLHPAAQVAVKQRVLEDNLWHLGKVQARAACCGRSKARPGATATARGCRCAMCAKKGTVLVGFHERKSRYVADMQVCPVLPPHVSAMLLPLRALVGGMDQRDRLPQIELAGGRRRDRAGAAPPGAADRRRPAAAARLRRRAWRAVVAAAQGAGHGAPARRRRRRLAYALPEFGVTMPFKPTDFTQVNPHINRVLVARAVRLLGPQPTSG